MDNSSIDFYWVDGGAKDVSVTVTALGQLLSETASFEVRRPNVEVTSVIKQVHYSQFTNNVRLGYSDETGIDFTRTVDPAAMGTFRWTQIVNTYYAARTKANGDTEWTRRWGLDFRPSLGTGLKKNDSPNFPIDDTFQSYRIEFSASMYLMYRPDSIDSIWVPIKVRV